MRRVRLSTKHAKGIVMPATDKPKRIVDPKAIEASRLIWCECCGQRTWPPGSDVHELRWSHVAHLRSRGARGDDVPENLFSACSSCHGRSHQGTVKLIRNYPRDKPPSWFVPD